MIVVHRTALRRRVWAGVPPVHLQYTRHLRVTPRYREKEAAAKDPRTSRGGDAIEDEFGNLRSEYQAPKHPIVLAHGLFGFDELHVAGQLLPAVEYWSGIEDALAAKGIEVITATVPPSGRVEVRAQRLAEDIEAKANGKAVNIIAYGPRCDFCPAPC